MNKKAIVIGSGLGGLATALRLARRGYRVEVVEQYKQAGGRLNQLESKGFTFDMAPTFFSMSYVFEEFIKDAAIEMPFKFVELEPLYTVNFKGSNRKYIIYKDLDKLAEQFADIEPDFKNKMERFLGEAGKLFHDVNKQILNKNFMSLADFVVQMTKIDVRHTPKIVRTVWKELDRFFESYEVKVIFSLVAFFLGSTPFDTPAVYSILSYTEMKHDGYHNVEGGMYRIVEGMIREMEAAGVKIHYNTEIVEYESDGKRITAFTDTKGERWEADLFVVNADAASFRGQVMKRQKFSSRSLDNMQWTLAPFTMYLGVKGTIAGLDHHNYFLGSDYREYSSKIFKNKIKLDSPYYYVNANSRFNKSSAPEGCENLFILCPVPDLRYKPDWSDREWLADVIIDDISERTGFDVRSNLITKVVLDPVDWQNMFALYRGSGLGLGHKITQVGAFRPSNRDEEFKNLFYVGASTVPGTGLPMVMISSRLTVERIENEFKPL
jgi:phytoene desaturase